jgi:hypothetical protein
MRQLQRRLSGDLEIIRTVIGLLLLAVFYGACIIGGLCALLAGIVYACTMTRIEATARMCRHRLAVLRGALPGLLRSATWRKVATTENRR